VIPQCGPMRPTYQHHERDAAVQVQQSNVPPPASSTTRSD
jgi:hypothetical protein